ncbi:MAG: hypothetical protein WC860_01245 [Candidatus Margulisiibacteriota bacterium]|jgi:hypothetical protein
MKSLRNELRLQFYAQTDIEIYAKAKRQDWQNYALWLENLAIEKLNQDIILENKKLREAFCKAQDILESGLLSPI